MTAPVAVFLVYLLILFGLAVWSRHETQSMDGFFLGGRKLPPWVVAFSTNATGESGWLLLGLTGMGYAVGLQAFWVVVGEVIGIALTWILIAKRLKLLADESGAITVPDVLAARFVDRAHVLRAISVLIILTMVGAYVAAQMVASGKAFSGFLGIDYSYAVVIGAVIIITYTFVGGYKAVAYTDLVQGLLMLVGLVLVPVVAISAAGGWSSMMETLREIDPVLLNPLGGSGSDVVVWIAIFSFLAIGLPFLGVPQLMVRFMSIRDANEIRIAGRISILVLLIFDAGAVLAGMAGRALFPVIDDPETIFPLLSVELFPPIITGILMVVVLSAIMSTADSLLLLASSAVVKDFLHAIRKSTRSDQDLARIGKLITIVIGLGGAAFALYESPVIFWFVLFAWSGLGAAFGPPIICGLFFRRTTLNGAIAGVLGGFLTTVIWVLAFKSSTHDLYEMIPGFSVGMALTISVSLLEKEKEQ